MTSYPGSGTKRGWVERQDRVCVQLGRGDGTYTGEVTGPTGEAVYTGTGYQGVRRVRLLKYYFY